MSWEMVKLAEVCKSISDGDHQPPPKSESGIPFVTISNITNVNKFDFTNTMFVPREYYDSLDEKRRAQIGDILYSVVGSFGIPVYMDEEQEFVFQRHIAILRPDSEKIVPKFLYYTMLNRDFYMKADAVALGAAQRTVSLTALRGMEIQIPECAIQKKIVEILKPYDDLIENNQKQIKLLEEATQRLYKEWFVDMRFPGYEKCKIVDGVPEEWGYKPLREIMKYVRGKSYTSKELSDSPSGAVMVNLKNIRAFGGYNRNAEKWFLGKYKLDQTLREGDIVMGVTDMTKERRLVGHVALIPRIKEEDVTFSMDLIKIIPLNVTKSYLYSTFYYGGYSRNISSLANGVNVLHLKPESMMELKMLVPNENIQKKYEELFSILQRKIEMLQNQIENAAEARNRLLPKLMNGEIEV